MSSKPGKFTSWYWNQHILWDSIFAIALFLLFCCLKEWFHWDKSIIGLVEGNRSQIYSALLSVYGSLLGFVISAAVFTAGFIENKTFDKLLAKGSFYDIFGIYSHCSKALAFGFVIALASLVFDSDKAQSEGSENIWLLLTNLFALVLVAFRIWKTVWILHWIADLHVAKTRHEKDDG